MVNLGMYGFYNLPILSLYDPICPYMTFKDLYGTNFDKSWQIALDNPKEFAEI